MENVALHRIVGDRVQCLLCPHNCVIAEGRTGICGARKNIGNEIVLQTYGVLSGYSLDPVEKKPLYHFFPGYNILSAGSFGCNMRCDFCQNYQISQTVPEKMLRDISPGKLVNAALSYKKNIGIAFTYNEPVISFEFMRDAAVAAKENGLYTVMVSNGFVNSEPLREITEFIDGFNIDLKAFNNNFYRQLAGADIEPVKSALKLIAKSGKHLEVTTLVIPGKNDREEEMAAESEWIAGELGKSTPLHLSIYHPMHKRHDPPTSDESVKKLAAIASLRLEYVYTGNTHTGAGQNTICPGCGQTVTIRSGFSTRLINLDDKGKCKNCGLMIYRYLTPAASSARSAL